MDASKGFAKEGKNNKLRACNIKKITDVVTARTTVPGLSRLVTVICRFAQAQMLDAVEN